MRLPLSFVLAGVTLIAASPNPNVAGNARLLDLRGDDQQSIGADRSIVAVTCVALPSEDNLTILECGKRRKVD